MTSLDQIDLAHAVPFRLGPLMVEPPLRQITAARSETLEPRVMQVLVVLAMANGAIVSRDDLVRQCWEGRIVGDDSINRVIARLRKLVEDHGDGAVRIETITKVGYRLIGAVVLTIPSQRPPLASETAVTADAPTTKQSADHGIRLQVAAAASVALVTVTALFWWGASPTPKLLQASLRVGAFKPLSADLPVMLPAELQSELLAKVGESTNKLITVVNAPPKDLSQAYVVSGTIARSGDGLRYVVNLSREDSGATPLSLSFDRPRNAGGTSNLGVASMTARIVSCTLRGIVEGRTKPLPNPTVRLWSQFCRADNAEQPSFSYETAILREIVKTSPDFSVAWGLLAAGLSTVVPEEDTVAGRAARAEVLADIAIAEKTGPPDFVVWLARAGLRPAHDWVGRGQLFREAAERLGTQSNGISPGIYATFLLNVGRVADANAQLRLSREINSVPERTAARLAMGLNWSGQIAEGDAVLRKVLATYPESKIARQHQIGDALWRGNYPVAVAAVADATAMESGTKKVVAQTVAALQSGDARAGEAAAGELMRLSAAKDTRQEFAVAALAALGRDGDAFKVAELLLAGNRVPPTAILFQPALARARALPAFADLVGRLGLTDYWRKTGQFPDFCTVGEAPTLCAMLKAGNQANPAKI